MDVDLRTTTDPVLAGPIASPRTRAPSPWPFGASFFLLGTAAAGVAAVLARRGSTTQAFHGTAAAFGLLVALGAGLVVLGLTVHPRFLRPRFPRLGLREPGLLRPGLRADTLLPLAGVAAVVLVQATDLFATALGNAPSSEHAAASILSRAVVLTALPAMAWALTAARPARSLRLLLGAAATSAVVVSLLAAPGPLLSVVFGERYRVVGPTLRTLTGAAVLSVGALAVSGVLGASGRLPWAWTAVAAGVAASAALFGAAAAGDGLDLAVLASQAFLLALLALHASRLRPVADPAGVLILNWRDTQHPEGGGSEVFVEEVAARLAEGGRAVTLFCARHERAPSHERAGGVRIVRRGSRRTVYLWGFLYHLTGRLGRHGVVVDVQNGIPFFSALYCHKPVVVLVHHVHREQWPIVFRPRMARFGWWIESRLAPHVYRGARYVAVSGSTRSELAGLGVDPRAVTVVRNGTNLPERLATKSPFPSIVVLGRLVPHKRVEMVLEAATALRLEIPDLQVFVVGTGYWEGRLRVLAKRRGIAHAVHFLGRVDEAAKGRLLGAAWVLAMPSLKEGWGLAVIEAAAWATPAVGFTSAGGLGESIVHGRTGLLVRTPEEFGPGLRRLLLDESLRRRLGEAARIRAASYRWANTARDFEAVLEEAILEAGAGWEWMAREPRRGRGGEDAVERTAERRLEPQVP